MKFSFRDFLFLYTYLSVATSYPVFSARPPTFFIDADGCIFFPQIVFSDHDSVTLPKGKALNRLRIELCGHNSAMLSLAAGGLPYGAVRPRF
jgi:hypothetical protein